MDRTILHCDCNSFFASVELLERPELKALPVAVCGDPEHRRGVILAKNEPAKKTGVKTGEAIWQAMRKCPDLVLLPPHHHLYSRYSREINEIYEGYTNQVEPFGIDESWLDVTDSLHLFGSGRQIADEIRHKIREELRLTVSVGVSFNKVFAKLGSDYKKPDATTVITRDNFRQLLYPLPVNAMLYVGQVLADRMSGAGIRTIGQLAALDPDTVVRLFGKTGEQIHLFARGEDDSPVADSNQIHAAKSIGRGMTFSHDMASLEEIRPFVKMLSDSIASQMRSDHVKCRTIQLTIRNPQFKTITRQKPLTQPSFLTREIDDTAMSILQESWSFSAAIRMLTVTGSQLVHEDEAPVQMSLFDQEQDSFQQKQEKLELSIDQIRHRFGRKIIAIGQTPSDESDD